MTTAVILFGLAYAIGFWRFVLRGAYRRAGEEAAIWRNDAGWRYRWEYLIEFAASALLRAAAYTVGFAVVGAIAFLLWSRLQESKFNAEAWTVGLLAAIAVLLFLILKEMVDRRR